MAKKRDYYEVLGVTRQADEGMLKKAYRKLAKKYHPDTNFGDAEKEQKFKEVTEAYTILSDPEKRKLYDQFGHAAFDGSGTQSSQYQKQGFQEFHFENENMNDIFEDIFGDIFRGKNNSFHSHGFAGQHVARKGSDLELETTISFDEAVFGCEKMIKLRKQDGSVQTLQVHIPAGIETGKTVRLKEKGNPGVNGGKHGDLMIRVKVEEKPGFERKGMDIYSTIQIPYPTAVFGGEVKVHTLYGDVMCKIKEGTQSGSKIRLRGKGVVSMKNSAQYGDHYITIQIQVPKNLTSEAKKKLREYEAIYPIVA